MPESREQPQVHGIGVTPLFPDRVRSSPTGLENNEAAVRAAVTGLVSATAEVLGASTDALQNFGARTAPAAALALPRYHLDQAHEIVPGLRDQPPNWLGEGARRFRHTDLVEAIERQIDLLTSVFESLVSSAEEVPADDPVKLAEKIHAIAVELQALLNQPAV